MTAIALKSDSDTLALGARLGSVLRAGDIVRLTGDLGAGKTTLARGLISVASGRDRRAVADLHAGSDL
ncbi:tRNA (adenosine(37)-N6)-threonylcarbamoyltransferase complex ATPase subunit type 1 TsaE [Algimonas porphyrae]|uniref:tRNA (adenosine(37)-N6)-threonylcarbamoyltransferase complex ATPase subunit type 1 TsaE n=1 Tax=Algimonas porphyrae TaxID=1128113 RepID=UPI00352A4CC5